jgi:hypothetical protein
MDSANRRGKRIVGEFLHPRAVRSQKSEAGGQPTVARRVPLSGANSENWVGGLRSETGSQRAEGGRRRAPRKSKFERGISLSLPGSGRERRSRSLPNRDTCSGRLSRGGVSFSWLWQSAHRFRLSCVARVIASGGTPESLCQIRGRAA